MLCGQLVKGLRSEGYFIRIIVLYILIYGIIYIFFYYFYFINNFLNIKIEK